jgi:hypothetical protein
MFWKFTINVTLKSSRFWDILLLLLLVRCQHFGVISRSDLEGLKILGFDCWILDEADPLSCNFSNKLPTKAAHYSKQPKTPTVPRKNLRSYTSASWNYFLILYLFFETLTFIVVLKSLKVAENISMHKPSCFKILVFCIRVTLPFMGYTLETAFLSFNGG